MTITTGGVADQSGQNTRGVRSYSYTYLSNVTTRAEATVWQVGTQFSSDTGIVIGSVHTEDSNAYCTSIHPVMRTLFADWATEVTFTTEREMNVNPIFEPAVIEWGGENFDETLVYDRNGDAVLNSAGDPFENAMRERTRRVVTVMKNITNIPSWVITAEDAVNSSAFLLDGFSVGARLAKLSAPQIGRWQYRNGAAYREMTMTIKLNKDGWNFQPLDAGFRFRNGLGDLVRITSLGDGTDITQPVCLDGAGVVLSDPTPATAVYGDFEQYPEYDFNLLPLT